MITINVSGNITADALVKNVNGTDVINFSVASNRKYTDQHGEQKEETTFMNCQLWNVKPDVAKLLFKGRPVHVTGFFNTRSYVGSDGALKTAFNVRVSSFQVLGKGRASEQNNAAPVEEQQPQLVNNSTGITEPLDDLPF